MQDERRDDDALALRSRRGDARALAVLYGRHAPDLLAYVERLLKQRAEAEDVVQESFLRLFEGRGRYRPQGRFRQWLFTVATRAVQQRMRTAQRRERIAGASAGEILPARPQTPEEHAAGRELARRVESALHDLPETYAAAFHLRVRLSFSYREMATITDEPEGTLRSRVHHALKRLRHALAEHDPRQPRETRSERR